MQNVHTDLAAGEIQLILDTAEELLEVARRPIKKVPALRGSTVINLFMEPSTRTRFSFEVAEKRLFGGHPQLRGLGFLGEQGGDPLRHRPQPDGHGA